jgi:hypothetical protein
VHTLRAASRDEASGCGYWGRVCACACGRLIGGCPCAVGCKQYPSGATSSWRMICLRKRSTKLAWRVSHAQRTIFSLSAGLQPCRVRSRQRSCGTTFRLGCAPRARARMCVCARARYYERPFARGAGVCAAGAQRRKHPLLGARACVRADAPAVVGQANACRRQRRRGRRRRAVGDGQGVIGGRARHELQLDGDGPGQRRGRGGGDDARVVGEWSVDGRRPGGAYKRGRGGSKGCTWATRDAAELLGACAARTN